MGLKPPGGAVRIEKPGDVCQLVRHSVSRQRLQKNFTIGHALEPGVQQCEHAAVRLCANQAPKSLLQRQHRLRHLKLRKRVATVFLKSSHSRRHDRVAWHRKR